MEFDPTSSYAVEGLKPDTLYKFRLGARSELGVGVYTPTIEARTAQSSKFIDTALLKTNQKQSSFRHRGVEELSASAHVGSAVCQRV